MFTVKFIPLKIKKFTHYSKIIMCNLKLSWMILDLLLQNNLSTMEYIRIIQKVSKYHTNDQHWSRKIPYPTIYWRLPLFNKCLNTSYDFSQRVSITNYFPKIICKLFNSGWLSIFKILNKQTKWGEKSISLAGIPANKNSISWKKARSPQSRSEDGNNHPRQEWLLSTVQITEDWKKGEPSVQGEWAEVTPLTRVLLKDTCTAKQQQLTLSLSSYENALKRWGHKGF